MTLEQPPTRLEIAQHLAAHLGHPDFEEYLEAVSEDVTFRAGGNNALSGTYHGLEEVAALLRNVVERTGNTYDASKWEDWLVGENHVATIVRIHAQEHGAALTARLLILVAFNPSDKISEISVLIDDSGGVDRFIGP
jgi:hypothetical protein